MKIKIQKYGEIYMKFNGEIVFSISDINHIAVDFGTDILPTKIINKGDVIALGIKAPKHRWIYKIKYEDEKEYLKILEKILNQLCEKSKYINELTKIYEEVRIDIYIRSEFAQIGYSLPSHIIQKMALLECPIGFDILSFGMVME